MTLLFLLPIDIASTSEDQNYSNMMSHIKFGTSIINIEDEKVSKNSRLKTDEISIPISLKGDQLLQKFDTKSIKIKPWFYVCKDERHTHWLVIYWVSFLLSWIIIPFLQGYVFSGSFSVLGRSIYSLKINFIAYAVIILLVIPIFTVYVRIITNVPSWSAAVVVIMSLANAVGLVALLALLGYGIVAIPFYVWWASDPYIKKILLKEQSAVAENELERAKNDLLGTCLHIRSICTSNRNFSHHTFPFLNALLQKANNCWYLLENEETFLESIYLSDDTNQEPLQESSAGVCPNRNNNYTRSVIDYERNVSLPRIDFGEQYESEDTSTFRMDNLIQLNQSLDEQRDRCKRLYWELEIIHGNLEELDLVDERNPDELLMTGTQNTTIPSQQNLLSTLLKISSIIMGMFSVVLFWSEVTLSMFIINRKEHKSPLAKLIPRNFDGIFTPFIILYILFCTMHTLLESPLVRFQFRLLPHQHTDAKTLLFIVASLNRLSIPLAYNYLRLLSSHYIGDTVQIKNIPDASPTEFARVMGTIGDAPVLGTHFNLIIPLSLVIVCVIALVHKVKTAHRLYFKRWQLLGETLTEPLIHRAR